MWLVYKINSAGKNFQSKKRHTEWCGGGLQRRHWTDRVTQAMCLRDMSGTVGGVWGAGVHGTAPASITAIHCSAAIQYKRVSAIWVNFKELVYSEMVLQSGTPPCHVPAARQGQCPAYRGSRNRYSMGWGTDVCGRPMTAGISSRWCWQPLVLLLSNTQTTVYNATHMLRLLTIQVVTQTHSTTSANYSCGLSIGTNILPGVWPKI